MTVYSSTYIALLQHPFVHTMIFYYRPSQSNPSMELIMDMRKGMMHMGMLHLKTLTCTMEGILHMEIIRSHSNRWFIICDLCLLQLLSLGSFKRSNDGGRILFVFSCVPFICSFTCNKWYISELSNIGY